MSPPRPRWRQALADKRGVAAVEFAFVAPVLMTLLLVGFETSQAVSTYRKLTNTTVEMANVVSQYTTMGSLDINSVFNASSQIMTPYATQNLTIVISEIATDAKGNATVQWSIPYNGATALTCNSPVTLPTGLSIISTYYILVKTTYNYIPVVAPTLVSAIPMSDQIYMLPRQSSSIPYTDSPKCG